jgi:hypothetical protein
MNVVPAFEMFMTQLEGLAWLRPALEPLTTAALVVAYKYYNKMDCSDAYVITLCKFPQPDLQLIKSGVEMRML